MGQDWPITLTGFEPIERIGSGGFGQVWLAEQTDLDRVVAVKIGHRPFETADDQRRFERECKALGRLTGHANIIDVHTSGVSDGLPFLVLEYIDGGTLADRRRQLDEQRLRRIATELCDAVAAAHAVGVIHRDLKPENVFLEESGRTVLGDFGIARLGDGNDTVGGGIPASIGFAAPETLEGVPPSTAADIYGIGVTIAAAVLGRSPFVTGEQASVEAVVVNVLNAPPPDLTAYGLSSEFAAVLAAAMAKDPTQRPQSASDLGAMIRGLAPPTAHAPGDRAPAVAGRPGEGPSSGSGSRWLAIGAGVLAALAVLAGLTAVVLRNGPNDGAPSADRTASTAGSDTAAPGDDTGDADDGAEQPGDRPAPSEVAATSSSSTTSVAALPLVVPLNGPTITEVIGLPLDPDGVDPLLGPADSPQICDRRPDITGLTETVAGVYPSDATADGSFRQVAQRMHRFSTPAQASAFIASYVEIPCDRWEVVITSDGLPSTMTATAVPPSQTPGDEISVVDVTTTVPAGVPFYSRTVLVRHGSDVLKLFYQSLDQDEVAASTDLLLAAATESLGY